LATKTTAPADPSREHATTNAATSPPAHDTHDTTSRGSTGSTWEGDSTTGEQPLPEPVWPAFEAVGSAAGIEAPHQAALGHHSVRAVMMADASKATSKVPTS
jgi:hypothetical protein